MYEEILDHSLPASISYSILFRSPEYFLPQSHLFSPPKRLAMETLPIDLTSCFPVVIASDWDASNLSHGSLYHRENANATTRLYSTPRANLQWDTGFDVFVDQIWERLSASVKNTIRGACLEVLKRTNDDGKKTERTWDDNDAHMLD